VNILSWRGMLRDASGKIRCGAPMLGFADPTLFDRFTRQLLDAVHTTHPELFGMELAA
jgi:hypothetical protein